MADLVPVAADVAAGAGAGDANGTSGATLTAGMVAYTIEASGKYGIADCTTSAATAEVSGIMLNGASDTQPAKLHTRGPLDLGCTITVGTIYVLSASGGICPSTDLARS